MLLLKILLFLYPSSFRSEYGEEMRRIFARRREAVSTPIAIPAWWIATFFEILLTAAQIHLDVLRQDLGYAVRGLARSPGFAVAAVVITALGIGANTAVFSIVDHAFLRPLPYPEAHQIFKLWEKTPQRARGSVSAPNYRDWKEMSSSFESMGASIGDSMTLTSRGEPRRLTGAAVSTGALQALGIEPYIGRSFNPDDERAGADRVILLSEELWKTEFGRDPGILGTSLRFGEMQYTVIGVMPSTLSYPDRNAEYWRPLHDSFANDSNRGNRVLDVVAKLKDTVLLEQAQAEMAAITARLARDYLGQNENTGVTFSSLREETSLQSRLFVAALFGASLCVLLIACSNLASLVLTRGVGRQREITVRAALGAGRERLVRQLLTESLMLALLGGAAGVLVAIAGVPILANLAPVDVSVRHATAIDLRVLAFAALLSFLSGLGFGVLPALRSCSPTSLATLSSKSVTGTRGQRLKSVLVSAQVASSIVLVICSGLLIRALWRIQAIDLGFQVDNVVAISTPIPMPQYSDVARRLGFYSSILPRVRAVPGVADAAFITFLPLVTGGGVQSVNRVDRDVASMRFVSPGFFSTMRIPIRTGRDVSESDTLENALVAVVSESFVRRHFPGLDPLGQEFHFADATRRIVGVANDIRVRGLELDSEPQVYLPYRQLPPNRLGVYSPRELVVRASIPIGGVVPAIRNIVQQADPVLPLRVRTYEDILAAQTETRSAHVGILGAFATLSVVLAGIGLYGLLSFAVYQRIPEIGLRLALGASRRDILQMIVRQGALLASAGCITGMLLGVAAGWWLQALLAGVEPVDLVTLLSAACLAFAMTVAGSIVPALRAIRVDPVTVIRAE